MRPSIFYLAMIGIASVSAWLRAPQHRMHLKKVVSEDGSIDITDDKGNQVTAKPDKDNHVLTFNVGKGGNVIHVHTSPKKQEFEIRKLGCIRNDLADEDRTFLEAVIDALKKDESLDTVSVDTTASQVTRAKT